MQELATSASIALVMTAGVALRLGLRERPFALLPYFAFFFALESIAERFFLPEGSLGPEVAWVCFGLSIPLFAASYGWAAYERQHQDKDAKGDHPEP